MRIKVLEWWIVWLVLDVVYCGFLKAIFRIPYWMSASALVLFALASFRLASSVVLAWQASEFEKRMAAAKAATAKDGETDES